MEIKKADSKGRVSGFRPSNYYHLTTDTKGRDISLKLMGSAPELYILLEHDQRITEDAQNYLTNLGVDPSSVLRDSVCREGYAEFEFEADGKTRKFEFGQRVTTPRGWPDGFDWDLFASLIVKGLSKGG